MTNEDDGITQLQSDIRARLESAGIPEDYITDIIDVISQGERARETQSSDYHINEANRLSRQIDSYDFKPHHLIRLFEMHVAWLERHYPDIIISDHIVMYRNW